MILPRFLLHEAKENLGLSFYTKPQKYIVTYSCTVSNLHRSKNKITTIFPIPPSTDNQKVMSINLEPTNCKKDKRGFVYWNENLEVGDNKTYTEEFTVNIKPTNTSVFRNYEYEAYLKSERHVNFTHSKIKQLVNKLHPPKSDVVPIAKYLNNYIVKKLEYGKPTESLYSSVESISDKQTDCGGFSTLFAALLRYHKIPARIVCGYLLAPNSSVMHAWVEFMSPNKKWIPADPTIENLLKKRGTLRSGKFGFVGSDHFILSYGSDLKLKVNRESIGLDILQNPIVIASGGDKSVRVQFNLNADFLK